VRFQKEESIAEMSNGAKVEVSRRKKEDLLARLK
jgi:hypothetical protein